MPRRKAFAVSDIIPADDKLIVQKGYSGTGYPVEQSKTAGGLTLLGNQAENLINAVTVFAPPAAGETTLYSPIVRSDNRNA